MANTSPSSPRQVAVLDRKRVNEMDRLGDMGRFPVPVLSAATFNVLLTMAVVWHFEFASEHALFPLAQWIAGVLALNLLPVVLLRRTLGPNTVYPVIEEIHFFTDQHKFSNWVYLAASANMAFWISVTWTASDYAHLHVVIAPLLIIAFLATFFPAWIRLFRRS
jgi:hypothetical protein